MNYESRRITLSFPAIERLSQAYELPLDLPSHILAGYVERLIFESFCKRQDTGIPAPTPNWEKLAEMVRRNRENK